MRSFLCYWEVLEVILQYFFLDFEPEEKIELFFSKKWNSDFHLKFLRWKYSAEQEFCLVICFGEAVSKL